MNSYWNKLDETGSFDDELKLTKVYWKFNRLFNKSYGLILLSLNWSNHQQAACIF